MFSQVSLIWLSTLVCLAIGGPVSSGRNSMMFYQQRPVYYHTPQYYPTAHQAMLVHYGDPARQYASRRSGQASEVTAFAAGDTIGGETYIQDEQPIYESEPQQPAPLEDGDTLAVAEAYPDAPADEPSNDVPSSDNEIDQADTAAADIPVEDEIQPKPVAAAPAKKKVPKELAAPAPVNEVADEPADAEAAPVAPQKKKKVELVDADENDSDVPFTSNAPRPSNGSNGQWPLNTFFPMNFGSTSGGAIAVANSFSTGKGGTASSHATAYGSPAGRDKKRRLTQQQ